MTNPRFDKELPCLQTCRPDIVLAPVPHLKFSSVGSSERQNRRGWHAHEDVMCVNYITALFGWRIAIYCLFDGHGSGLPSKWCGIHVPHLVAGHLAKLHKQSESDASDAAMPAFVREIPAAIDSALREADQVLTLENVGESGTTATVAIIAEKDDGRRWLVVANVGDSAALLATYEDNCAKVLHHLDFEPPVDQRDDYLKKLPPYDRSDDPYTFQSFQPKQVYYTYDSFTSQRCFYFASNHGGHFYLEIRRVHKCGGSMNESIKFITHESSKTLNGKRMLTLAFLGILVKKFFLWGIKCLLIITVLVAYCTRYDTFLINKSDYLFSANEFSFFILGLFTLRWFSLRGQNQMFKFWYKTLKKYTSSKRGFLN